MATYLALRRVSLIVRQQNKAWKQGWNMNTTGHPTFVSTNVTSNLTHWGSVDSVSYRINVSKTNRRRTWCHWPGWESYIKHTVEVNNKFEGGKAELGMENSRAPHPLYETLVDVNEAIYVFQKWAVILYAFCSLQTVRNEGTDIIEILAPPRMCKLIILLRHTVCTGKGG